MKFRVTFVYWALLFTSVVSSGLLFLIVASESTEDRTGIENDGNLYVFDNFTTNDENEKYEIPEITIAKVRSPAIENEFLEESATKVTSSFDTVNTLDDRVENDLEIMAESIIQQPNLSQGFSNQSASFLLERNLVNRIVRFRFHHGHSILRHFTRRIS
uniref:Uncharacterized protein n=1 Tax=Vespula pensylvanica TaxID=30213 RepID=A0A834PDS5_VESPE|nr:hypothetical protein H0235_000392 [Vespula pensylvanica]